MIKGSLKIEEGRLEAIERNYDNVSSLGLNKLAPLIQALDGHGLCAGDLEVLLKDKEAQARVVRAIKSGGHLMSCEEALFFDYLGTNNMLLSREVASAWEFNQNRFEVPKMRPELHLLRTDSKLWRDRNLKLVYHHNLGPDCIRARLLWRTELKEILDYTKSGSVIKKFFDDFCKTWEENYTPYPRGYYLIDFSMERVGPAVGPMLPFEHIEQHVADLPPLHGLRPFVLPMSMLMEMWIVVILTGKAGGWFAPHQHGRGTIASQGIHHLECLRNGDCLSCFFSLGGDLMPTLQKVENPFSLSNKVLLAY